VKAHLFIGLLAIAAQTALPQGSINFNNRVTGTATSAVVAPIYGVDPANPFVTKYGNASTGPTTPIPQGTQTYAGAPLVGTGYTASIWGRIAGTSDPYVFAAAAPFRITTSTALFGFWQPPSTAAVLPNVPSAPNIRAEIIIRVWDNHNGQITTWDQAVDPANIYGAAQSIPFVVPDQLGGGTVLPPNLVGLQSFQLYSAPEPSVLALAGIALFGVLAYRRRR